MVFRILFGVAMMMTFVPSSLFAAALPATRDVIVFPGEQETIEIPIVNSGAVSRDYSAFLLSATFIPGVEQPQLQKLPLDITSWISLSASSMTIAPDATSSVVLTVRPPDSVMPQALVVAVAVAEKLAGDISVLHGSATLVFITVGDVSPRGSCTAFIQRSIDLADLSLANDGSGILYDSGTIVLRGMFGIRLGTAPSNPLFHRIPSGQSRTWQVPLPPVPWWAFGPLSYVVDDAQLAERPCVDIDTGVRWFPLLGIGIGIFGVGILFIRRRIS